MQIGAKKTELYPALPGLMEMLVSDEGILSGGISQPLQEFVSVQAAQDSAEPGEQGLPWHNELLWLAMEAIIPKHRMAGRKTIEK